MRRACEASEGPCVYADSGSSDLGHSLTLTTPGHRYVPLHAAGTNQQTPGRPCIGQHRAAWPCHPATSSRSRDIHVQPSQHVPSQPKSSYARSGTRERFLWHAGVNLGSDDGRMARRFGRTPAAAVRHRALAPACTVSHVGCALPVVSWAALPRHAYSPLRLVYGRRRPCGWVVECVRSRIGL